MKQGLLPVVLAALWTELLMGYCHAESSFKNTVLKFTHKDVCVVLMKPCTQGLCCDNIFITLQHSYGFTEWVH